MAEDVKSFGDLKSTLIKAKPAEIEIGIRRTDQSQSRRQGPRLCHRTAQERDRAGLDQARPRPDHGQRQGREFYFARPVLRMILRQPLIAASRDGQFDVVCTVVGGGLSGQAGAVRHGISRALIAYEPTLRPVLKAGGFLTRDPRAVERKKYGRPKARRSFQFSKR